MELVFPTRFISSAKSNHHFLIAIALALLLLSSFHQNSFYLTHLLQD